MRWLIVLSVLLLLPSAGFSQGRFDALSADEQAAISKLIAAAEAHKKAGECDKAIEKYQRVYKQFKHSKILWSIADCYDVLYRKDPKSTSSRQSAITYYKRYQKQGSDEVLLKKTKARLAVLEKHQKEINTTKSYFEETKEAPSWIRLGVIGQLSQTGSFTAGVVGSFNLIAGLNIEPRLYFESRRLEAVNQKVITTIPLGYVQVATMANYDWYFLDNAFLHVGVGPTVGVLVGSDPPAWFSAELNPALLSVAGFIGLGFDYKSIIASISAEFEESITSVTSGFGSNFGDTFFTLKVMYKF